MLYLNDDNNSMVGYLIQISRSDLSRKHTKTSKRDKITHSHHPFLKYTGKGKACLSAA